MPVLIHIPKQHNTLLINLLSISDLKKIMLLMNN